MITSVCAILNRILHFVLLTLKERKRTEVIRNDWTSDSFSTKVTFS